MLVNYLGSGEFRDTVSSVDDNLISYDLGGQGDKITVREVPGFYHLRARLLKAAEGSKVIVLLVDSKD